MASDYMSQVSCETKDAHMRAAVGKLRKSPAVGSRCEPAAGGLFVGQLERKLLRAILFF